MLTPAEKEVINISAGTDLDELGKSLGIRRTHARHETSPPQPETDEEYRARLLAWSETPYNKLTARERQVAEYLVLGKKNSEIAVELDCSVKTIDTHRGHIMQKLELRNNVELLRLAIARGWHSIDVEVS